MKKLLRISALITATLMIFVMIGCGGDDDEEGDKVAPTLVSTNPASGGEIAANGAVSMVFSEKMGEVTVSGAAGTVALGDGKNVSWTPTGNMPTGSVTLTIGGKDVAGNALASATVTLTVKAADITPPEFSADCDPKNGASGVDPAKVAGIKIVFSESMSEVKLDAFEPKDAKVDPKFDGDKTLSISFLGGYKLSNEMEIKATISGKDKAGNALKTTSYSFTTMKKEG